jgi:hypothetical protein
MIPPLLALLALLAAARAQGDACAPAPSAAVFALTATAPARCRASELAVLWPRINVTTFSGAGCYADYEVSGANATFAYPASPAVLCAGGNATFQVLSYEQPVFPRSNVVQADDEAQSASRAPADFDGFARVLNASWPKLTTSTFAPNGGYGFYNFYIRKNGFDAVSLVDNCTYSYALVNGSFAGISQVSGKRALCPAGTAGDACAPCPPGEFSPAVGAAACSPCSAGWAPTPGAASCAPPCSMSKYSLQPRYYTPAASSDNSTGLYAVSSDSACAACPAGSVAGANASACVGAAAGALCAAAGVGAGAEAPACPSVPDPAAAWGGAALALARADAGAPNCAPVARLAAFLSGKLTFLGFNFSAFDAAAPGRGSVYGSIYDSLEGLSPWGVQWQLLGAFSPAAAGLGRSPICGNAHGGPGPQPALTESGAPLSPRALLFRAYLEDSQVPPPLAARFQPSATGAWGVVMEPGEEEGTLVARYFQDASGSCGATSLGAAGLPRGECALTLRVVGGAALGVAAPEGTGCPLDFHSQRPSSGAPPACRACAPGYEPAAGAAGGCTPCAGAAFKPFWGDAACEECSDPFPADYDAPPGAGVAAWYCFDGRGRGFPEDAAGGGAAPGAER